MLLRNTLLPGSLALVAGLLGGCGAGEAIFGPETVTLQITPSLDGYVTDLGAAIPSHVGAGIVVGDSSADVGRRGIVRFSLLGLPPGAEIVSAELRMAQASVVGAPYATLGDISVDHVDIGAGLDGADYDAGTLVLFYGLLSIDPVLSVQFMDVKLAVKDDLLAGRTTSDFRLRFPTETDSDALLDQARFEDMENNLGTGQVPLLVIEYK